MFIYNYDPETFLYVSTTSAPENPLVRGTFMVPANATTLSPPTTVQFQSARFNTALRNWETVPNYYGIPLYDKATAEMSEKKLAIGEPLPATLTADPPGNIDFPMWDSALDKWVENTKAKEEALYASGIFAVTLKLENALRILEDNDARMKIPGVRVLSGPNEAKIRSYISEMQDFVDLLMHTGPRGYTYVNTPEPIWPFPGEPDNFDVELFDTVHSGPTAGLTAQPWRPNTAYEAGSLIYSMTGEGLFVAPNAFTSNPTIGSDITLSNMISVVPVNSGLRYMPVSDIATLAAQSAKDFAICKVLVTGDEYVFHKGATVGDVRDNQRTGYWIKIASPITGRYLTFSGQIFTPTKDIVIGVQPFNVDHELVFINGSLRIDAEYTTDWTTGTITLNQEMQANDTWKVLVMS